MILNLDGDTDIDAGADNDADTDQAQKANFYDIGIKKSLKSPISLNDIISRVETYSRMRRIHCAKRIGRTEGL